MAAKTKAKASKVTEVKPTEAEVKETVTAQEPQAVEENVAEETVTDETTVGIEPEGEITEGVCVDEIIEPDTCGLMPKSDENEVYDGNCETIQTDTPDIEEKPVSENKQGNLGYAYVHMWNGMAFD